jgi:hypothetical protein
MRSSVPMICLALKKALELCAALNFDITARWIPRRENEAADALSRESDASDWGIEKGVLQTLLDHFGLQIAINIYRTHRTPITSAVISFCSTIRQVA